MSQDSSDSALYADPTAAPMPDSPDAPPEFRSAASVDPLAVDPLAVDPLAVDPLAVDPFAGSPPDPLLPDPTQMADARHAGSDPTLAAAGVAYGLDEQPGSGPRSFPADGSRTQPVPAADSYPTGYGTPGHGGQPVHRGRRPTLRRRSAPPVSGHPVSRRGHPLQRHLAPGPPPIDPWGYGASDQSGYGLPAGGHPAGDYGYPGYPQRSDSVSPPTNAMAILALVFALLLPPLGLAFGFVARRQIRRTGEDGDGIALAGLVIGGILTAFIVLVIVAPILFILLAAATVG